MPQVIVKDYRSPQGDRVATKRDENAPRPISMIGGGRGGALIAFAEGAKGSQGSG